MPCEVGTSSHWGTYLVDVDDSGLVVGARPYADDPDAAPGSLTSRGARRVRARHPAQQQDLAGAAEDDVDVNDAYEPVRHDGRQRARRET
jgi:hypothetical protein